MSARAGSGIALTIAILGGALAVLQSAHATPAGRTSDGIASVRVIATPVATPVPPAPETPAPATPAPTPTPVVTTNLDTHEGPKDNLPDKAPKPKPAPAAPVRAAYAGPEIEGYAPYDGQSTCDPAAKPGTLALRNLLLAHYPSTGSAGISRACDVGGRSEHKEGRAFDWAANVGNATQRAAVDDFITSLFATDLFGNTHALARRMGIMYVIWNRQIWMAGRASAGWQPYTGASPHTDHVHISMSWAGARAQTSFWSGSVVPGIGPAPEPSSTPRPDRRRHLVNPTLSPEPTPSPTPDAGASPTPRPTASPRHRPRRPTPTPAPTMTPHPTTTPDPTTTPAPTTSPTPAPSLSPTPTA